MDFISYALAKKALDATTEGLKISNIEIKDGELIITPSVGNPIKFLEAGTTWNRGASNIMSTSLGIMESRIPIYFASQLRARGIPIQ